MSAIIEKARVFFDLMPDKEEEATVIEQVTKGV